METKVCNVCNIEKQILNFYFRKDKNFYINQCNDCVKERKRIHYAQNIEQIKESRLEFRKNNREILADNQKKYRKNNKETVKNGFNSWKLKNLNYYKEYQKKYKQENKLTRNLKEKERKLNDPIYHLSSNMRKLISQCFLTKGYKKNSKSEKILGCSFEDFKKHIESQFETWMCWDNYGNPKDGLYEPNKTWDIDHIIPVSSGLTEEDVIKLNHYTNLKPLCSYVNRFVKRNLI